MDEVKSFIRNQEYIKQVVDFKNLKFGTIVPTDIDTHIEYHDECHVLVEYKFGDGIGMPGQRKAFDRLCADLSKVKPTLGIRAQHWEPRGKAIDAGNTKVVQVMYRGRFLELPKEFTTRELIDLFLRHPRDLDKWDFQAPLKLDAKRGIKCGITGYKCKSCEGVPCTDSEQWEAA